MRITNFIGLGMKSFPSYSHLNGSRGNNASTNLDILKYMTPKQVPQALTLSDGRLLFHACVKKVGDHDYLYVLKNATVDDAPQLTALLRKTWTNRYGRPIYNITEDMIRDRIQTSPTGIIAQYAIPLTEFEGRTAADLTNLSVLRNMIDRGEINFCGRQVGVISVLFKDYSYLPQKWNEITNYGYYSGAHNPQGQFAVCPEIGADQNLGAGKDIIKYGVTRLIESTPQLMGGLAVSACRDIGLLVENMVRTAFGRSARISVRDDKILFGNWAELECDPDGWLYLKVTGNSPNRKPYHEGESIPILAPKGFIPPKVYKKLFAILRSGGTRIPEIFFSDNLKKSEAIGWLANELGMDIATARIAITYVRLMTRWICRGKFGLGAKITNDNGQLRVSDYGMLEINIAKDILISVKLTRDISPNEKVFREYKDYPRIPLLNVKKYLELDLLDKVITGLHKGLGAVMDKIVLMGRPDDAVNSLGINVWMRYSGFRKYSYWDNMLFVTPYIPDEDRIVSAE